MSRLLALVPALALLVACEERADCTLEARASVTLTVQDAAGNALTDATATYTVHGTTAPCEAITDGGNTLVCGWETPGEFVITASAPGFEDKSISVDVWQDDEECHVDGVAQTIVLDPVELACTEVEVGSVSLTVTREDAPFTPDFARWRSRDGDGAWADCDAVGDQGFTCGWEVAGELEVQASDGERTVAERVLVEANECHVITEVVELDFAAECPAVEVASVVVTTIDSDVITDIDSVHWGLANADMAPQPCESQGAGQYVCGWGTTGLIEIYGVYGDLTLDDLVEVLPGECGPLTEEATLWFNPGQGG